MKYRYIIYHQQVRAEAALYLHLLHHPRAVAAAALRGPESGRGGGPGRGDQAAAHAAARRGRHPARLRQPGRHQPVRGARVGPDGGPAGRGGGLHGENIVYYIIHILPNVFLHSYRAVRK